jgi:hypothetical protein
LSFARALLPAAELLLLVGPVVANPVRIRRRHPALRWASLVLTALITVANAFSAALLIHALLTGNGSNDATGLLGSGGAIYMTNIIAFGLWYWEFDRGARSPGPRPLVRTQTFCSRKCRHRNWLTTAGSRNSSTTSM